MSVVLAVVDYTEVLLTGVVVPLLGLAVYYVQQKVKAQFKPDQLNTVQNLARLGVQAAEQLESAGWFGTDDPNLNDAKFNAVKDFLIPAAKKVGIKLNEAEVVAFIQQVVAEKNAVEVQDRINNARV